MWGSSAAKSYGSLGSSCAMRPPHGRVSRPAPPTAGWLPCVGADLQVRPNRTMVLTTLLNRQHAVERDAVPVLHFIWNNDAVGNAALEQLIQDPQQMVRRHAEHRRAEAAELIE